MGPGLLLLFIVGDMLGAGVYAVTGQMAVEVGGVVWLPLLVAFGVSCSGTTVIATLSGTTGLCCSSSSPWSTWPA